MNTFELLDSIGNIDGKYILEAKNLKPVNTQKVRRKSGKLMLLIAAIIALLLAATAYAAVSYFGILDMTKGTYLEVPQEAAEYIEQQAAFGAAEEWNCQVNETLFSASKFLISVGVSGGDRYIVAPTYASPWDTVFEIGMEGTQTLGEYAEQQGKKLLFVGATLKQWEELGISVQGQRFVNVSESEMTILITGEKSNSSPVLDVTCEVYALPDGANDVQRVQLPITVVETPVVAKREYASMNPDVIPGIHVEKATVLQTALGLEVEFISSVTDNEAFENILKMDCDEIPSFQGGGFTLRPDGTWSTQWTMGQGNVLDTLTIHFYDLDKEMIGTMIFKNVG